MVWLPSTLHEIGEKAFENCRAITHLCIKVESVFQINYKAKNGDVYTLISFEDCMDDLDYDDLIFALKPIGVFAPVPEIANKKSSTTGVYAFEDLWPKKGDYDLNDVVVKARRLSDTKVEYSIVACGAYDKLFVKNINAGLITDDVEIHTLFGKSDHMFINTENGKQEQQTALLQYFAFQYALYEHYASSGRCGGTFRV